MDITKLEKQLTIDEGKSLEVYLDTEGLPTVGIGHLVRPKDKLKVGDKITEEQCSKFFREDVDVAVKECYKVFPEFAKFPEELKQVMANMMFNLGPTRFRGFKKMIQHVNDWEWREAAKEMTNSKWYGQVGLRSKRLVVRVNKLCGIKPSWK